jgi:3-dehydroquinate dehydratase/shikimate dehydrogenase
LMKDKSQARICVPVCVSRASDIAPAIARAEQVADIIELRLDCLTQADFSQVERDLAELCQQSSRPIIFTLRPAEQGGRHALTRETRLRFWSSEISRLLTGNENYADVELDIALGLMHTGEEIPAPDWNRVICSYHDFTGVPAELEKIYERMAQTKARILKIAVQANDITDCLPLLRLLERARHEWRELIAIAMGAAGIMTRILAPARGAFLTYGSLDAEQATAPGQIAATELRDLYRIHQLDSETEILGLVGNPVTHSVSPHIHNTACAAAQVNAVYIPFEVRNLDDFMRRMVQQSTREIDWKLRGLSVTAPHKSAVMPHLDWIEPSAQEIGAVNTIRIEGERLYGYNTDAQAALAPLRELIDLNEARVAVIGAGGAARSLLWGLRGAGARVTVFARNLESATETARRFGANCESLDGARFGEFAVVVNATPLGTRGLSEDETPAVASQLRGASIAYDLVYNPCETRFMREALTAGCHSIGGLQMLVAQAAAQFKLWTGQDAPVETMREAARKAVTSDR